MANFETAAGGPTKKLTARGRLLPAAGFLIGALAFGAADQYVGSLYSPFATAISLMSAPWLMLP